MNNFDQLSNLLDWRENQRRKPLRSRLSRPSIIRKGFAMIIVLLSQLIGSAKAAPKSAAKNSASNAAKKWAETLPPTCDGNCSACPFNAANAEADDNGDAFRRNAANN